MQSQPGPELPRHRFQAAGSLIAPRCSPIPAFFASAIVCSTHYHWRRFRQTFHCKHQSAFNYISPAAAREVTKVQGKSIWIVKGISGKVDKVYMAKKAVLTFGHIRQ